MWGAGTTLVNRGTIEATGLNGRGVWFHADAAKFDNSGSINAGANDAIFIDNSSTVGEINIMNNATRNNTIIGNITNNGWITPTKLTFGKIADGAGAATDDGDTNFGMTYSGNITGTGRFDLETWGGETTLNGGTVKIYNGRLGQGTVQSTLNLPGTVTFNSLTNGDLFNNPNTVLDGKSTGKIRV